MKYVNLGVALLAILSVSCDEDPSTPPPPPEPVTETHIIRDVDYVKNKYFFFADLNQFIAPQRATIEVYRTVTPQDLIIDPAIVRITGWVMPDTLSDGQVIRNVAEVLNANGSPCCALRQEFTPLTEGEDYALIGDSVTTVGIELFEPIPASALKSIGVSYVNVNAQSVGGTYASLGVNDPLTGQPPTPHSAADWLMLKMIKAPDPNPLGVFGSTYRLAMRHVYDLGFANITFGSLKIVIKDLLNITRANSSTPEGSDVPYIQIFGIDQMKEAGGGPDGRVDAMRLDLERGLLWFADVRAFAPNPDSVTAWTDGQFEFTGLYQAQYDKSRRIYEELLNPTQEADAHQYIIEATITKPAP